MGRKAGIVRVNPKAMTRKLPWPCFSEMLVFLAALRRSNFDDVAVMAEKTALNNCMDLQARKGKQRETINYHLQRISKMMKL